MKEKCDELLVDDHSHSLLTMHSLGAVNPHWGRVVDHDGVCRGRGRCCCDGHEARVDTRNVGVHGDGLAGLVEG